MARITESEMKQRINALGVGKNAHEWFAILDSLRDNTPAVTVYADSGAIAVESHTAVLTKGSAAAMTLATPTSAQNGTTITFLNTAGQAHVVTSGAANGIADAWGSGVGNTWTFNAGAGMAGILVAYEGVWYGGTVIGGGSITDV